MKKITARNKIIFAIVLLIIIIGTVVVILKGFKVDLLNRTSQNIVLNIGKNFEIDDIREMTKEVFENKQVIIQKVEVFDDSVSITSDEITDEQKSNIIKKINDKYETEIKDEDITIEDVPHTSIKDIIKPYIIPIIISTSIILVYIGIRYYKIGLIKSILEFGGILVIAEILLFALIAIIRFPIGRYTLPLVLFVYLISAIGITTNLEGKLQQKKLEEAKE